jgi:hypothetical protein
MVYIKWGMGEKSKPPSRSSEDVIDQNDGFLDANAICQNAPWLDLLAAGISDDSGQEVAWIAVVASHPRLLEFAASKRQQPTDDLWRRVCSTRARLTLEVLSHLIGVNAQKLRCEMPSNLQSLCAEYLKCFQTAEQYLVQQDCISIPKENKCLTEASNARTYIFSWITGNSDTATSNDTPENSSWHYACFDHLLAMLFGPIRQHFGTGWFANVEAFHEGIIKKSSESIKAGQYTYQPSNSTLPSAVIAEISTARLIEFGWKPNNLNSLPIGIFQSDDKSITKADRALVRLQEQGIHQIDLPKLSLKDESGPLDLCDSSQISKRLPFYYSSKDRVDRCLLVVEFLSYGSRSFTDGIDPNQKLYLFRLPLSGLNLINRFIQKVQSKAILYTPNASATTRSAVLDRLIRLYMLTPNDKLLKNCLKDEIRSLVYYSYKRPRVSTSKYKSSSSDTNFDVCKNLDARLGNVTDENDNTDTPLPTPMALRVPKSIASIVAQSEAVTASVDEAQKMSLSAGSDLLLLNAKESDKLQDVSGLSNPSRAANRAYKSIDRSIRANKNVIEKISLTSKSRFRSLTLYRELAIFMKGVMLRKLFIQDKLQKWITNHFRLVWMIPADSLQPKCSDLLVQRLRDCKSDIEGNTKHDTMHLPSAYPGSAGSAKLYPGLFSTTGCNGSLEADLYSLIDFALNSLSPSINSSSQCWLRHKIIETHQLMRALGEKLGYCSDFELSALLLNYDNRNDLACLFLEKLSSETILKCILIQNGGKSMLDQWAEKLMSECDKVFTKSRSTNDTDIQESSRPQLDVFLDRNGIIVAALDCCRAKVAGRTAHGLNVFKVFFRPSRLTKLFRPMVSYSNPGVILFFDKYDANLYETITGFEDTDNDTLDSEKKDESHYKYTPRQPLSGRFDIDLKRCFQSEPFPFDHTIKLLIDWYTTEGEDYGETIESLLNDTRSSLHELPEAIRVFDEMKPLLLENVKQKLSPIE